MHHGLGSLAVSTVFCVPTNRFTRNGCMCKRIPSELDWSDIRKIGRTKSGSPICYRSHSGFLPVFPRKRGACPTIAASLRNRDAYFWLAMSAHASPATRGISVAL